MLVHNSKLCRMFVYATGETSSYISGDSFKENNKGEGKFRAMVIKGSNNVCMDCTPTLGLIFFLSAMI